MSFYFIRPFLLLLLIPWALIFVLRKKYPSFNSSWEKVADENLLSYLLGQGNKIGFAPLEKLAFAIGVLAIIASSGPSFNKIKTTANIEKSALVLALDMSASMNAQDVSPSRLERAKIKIQDILKRHDFSYYALLLFSDDAYTVVPTTDDTEIILNQLPVISSNIMPTLAAKRMDRGIARSVELLYNAGFNEGTILLLTDEVANEEDLKAAREARSKDYLVSVLAFASEEGVPVPAASGGFEIAGKNIKLSKLDVKSLENLAKAGGGKLKIFTNDDSDLNFLFAGIKRSGQYNETTTQADFWLDAGIFVALPLLIMFSFMFIRNFIMVAVLFVLLFSSQAHAFDLRPLYLNRNQQGLADYKKGNYKSAEEKFEAIDWKGSAAYKSEDYKQAEKLFSEQAGVSGTYNKGNALALQGKYEEAIAAYDEVLAKEPNHEDAAYNKKILEELMNNQNSGGGGGGSSGGGSGGGSSDNENSSDSSGGGGENSDDGDEGEEGGESEGQGGGASGQDKKDEKSGEGSDQDKKDGKGKSGNAGAAGQETGNKNEKPRSSGGQGADKNASLNESNDPKQGEAPEGAENKTPGNSAGSEERDEDARGNNEKARSGDGKERNMTNSGDDVKRMLDIIEDDPGGLLREKMRRKYMRRMNENY